MTSPTHDYWQIQDAKQRFSEMTRAVAHDGPQIITRHGEEVAVVVDIAEYRRLTRPTVDLTGLLAGLVVGLPRADWCWHRGVRVQRRAHAQRNGPPAGHLRLQVDRGVARAWAAAAWFHPGRRSGRATGT
jgi:prevent-host-death family protein